jgi:hypothetical protein
MTSQKQQILRRELVQAKTNVPGIIHRWQGRVHTMKMLDMGIAQDGRNEEVTSVAFWLPQKLRALWL